MSSHSWVLQTIQGYPCDSEYLKRVGNTLIKLRPTLFLIIALSKYLVESVFFKEGRGEHG